VLYFSYCIIEKIQATKGRKNLLRGPHIVQPWWKEPE